MDAFAFILAAFPMDESGRRTASPGEVGNSGLILAEAGGVDAAVFLVRFLSMR